MATFLIFSLHSFSSHYHFSCHFHIFFPFFTSPFLSLLHCLLFIFLLSSSPFSPVGHQNSLQAELIHGSVPHHWRAWRHAYKSTHYWETHAHKHALCHKNDTACILISISKTWLNEQCMDMSSHYYTQHAVTHAHRTGSSAERAAFVLQTITGSNLLSIQLCTCAGNSSSSFMTSRGTWGLLTV